MELVLNDLRVGDIYEHEMGGFYQITEINKQTRLFVGHKINSKHPKDEFHSVEQIKNFFGMFR